MGWRSEAIAPDQWKPDQQPDLANALSEAKSLTLRRVAPGPQAVNSGHRPYLVPNADGTWDMVYPYFGKYFSTQQMVIHDFGTGETTSQLVGTGTGDTLLTRGNWEFHMCPSYYVNGKLLIANQGYEPVMFAIYDPEQNRIIRAVKPFGSAITRGRTALGDDGRLYGIGWNERQRDGFVAYWYDPSSDESWKSEPFGPGSKRLRDLYGNVAISGDWVYAEFGAQPWRLVGYNFKTQESRVLATTEDIIGDPDTISFTAIEGGLSGQIRNSLTINGGEKVASQRLAFWVHDGKLLPRMGKDTPWSGKNPVRIRKTSFDWDRQSQHWPSDFRPQRMTLEQLTLNSSDVTLRASDATLTVQDASTPGWNRVPGSKAYGGVALQNNGFQQRDTAHNGVATFNVTFSEPGKYYLYFHGRSISDHCNGGLAFSRGDKGADPISSEVISNYTRTYRGFGWRKAFQSQHNSEAFIYDVRPEHVGKGLTFKVATSYTGGYKDFKGVLWDALLLSKDPSKATSLVPDIPRGSAKIDINGRAVLSYRFENGPRKTVTYDLLMRNVPMKMIAEVNDHVLFALADQYGQHVFYNLKTRQVMRFDGALSPYSMGLAGSKLYVSGYPGAQLFEYAFADKDGRPLARAARTRVAKLDEAHDAHNPLGGTLVGADGNIYNAGITYGRRRVGGGFGWYDPRTEEIGGMPLPERIFWSTSADNHRYLIFSTKEGSAKEYDQIIGWDTKTQRTIYGKCLDGVGRAGPMAEALPGGLVMGYGSHADAGYLYGLNAATGEELWRKAVPEGPNTSFSLVRRHRYAFRRGPEGDIWTFIGSVLVRIDPRTAHVTVVGRLPEDSGQAQIAFAQGNVYIAWGTHLQQIEGLRVSEVHAQDDTARQARSD